ncbi:hypothetical protein GCM10010383_71680 [Streptomyces lomondensis]|uniref:Uncharacterized protein n=1 Tax=Streptomyces lomondensis TaxID=68229 RepID=A0ABQ2XSV5_9ACTN|nr:hypothetical protein GCM10010383_71680 [Streptomyces lomondensis]
MLCEKAFALDAVQAAEMVAVARERGLFLMEAMWSRFLPAYVKVRDLLAEGVIGEVQSVEADFGFRFPTGSRHTARSARPASTSTSPSSPATTAARSRWPRVPCGRPSVAQPVSPEPPATSSCRS